MDASKVVSKRVRSGLYRVTASRQSFTVENRQSPADYGSEWLWYITSDDNPSLWFDPCYTKSEALEAIRTLVESE